MLSCCAPLYPSMKCLLGRSTDDRFAREMYKKCEGHDRFELAPKMRVDHKFCVRHYAGKVVYSTEGIIEKNRDTLQQEGIDMLLSSASDFTVLLGEIEAKSTTVSMEALGMGGDCLDFTFSD